MKHNIILIGFMGTGKTTVGQALASELAWTFIDTDKEIEKLAGKPIPQIFADEGEARFRDLESQVIKRTMIGEHQVVSTGGGSVLRPENREAMLAGGLVVALTADAETIIARVSGDANRPLLAGDAASKVRKLMQEREGAYDFAHVSIDTSGKDVDEILQIIRAHAI